VIGEPLVERQGEEPTRSYRRKREFRGEFPQRVLTGDRIECVVMEIDPVITSPTIHPTNRNTWWLELFWYSEIVG